MNSVDFADDGVGVAATEPPPPFLPGPLHGAFVVYVAVVAAAAVDADTVVCALMMADDAADAEPQYSCSAQTYYL